MGLVNGSAREVRVSPERSGFTHGSAKFGSQGSRLRLLVGELLGAQFMGRRLLTDSVPEGGVGRVSGLGVLFSSGNFLESKFGTGSLLFNRSPRILLGLLS